jgi:secreted PhoX family phosphatase
MEVFVRGADLDARLGTSHSLGGADGVAFDVDGNLWVCANKANEIQVLSPEGRSWRAIAAPGPTPSTSRSCLGPRATKTRSRVVGQSTSMGVACVGVRGFRSADGLAALRPGLC